jgi:hypothetical protein
VKPPTREELKRLGIDSDAGFETQRRCLEEPIFIPGQEGPLTRAPSELPDEGAAAVDLVPELLDEWGFSAEEWRHWRVNPQPTNPGMRQWPTIPQPTGPKPKQGYLR